MSQAVESDWIALPPAPDAAGATGRLHLRYEDVCQDGRLLLEVLPSALGATIWTAQLARDPLALECREKGIVPILTRFVIEGTEGPFSVMTPMEATGRFTLAETEQGRVMLNMWAEVKAPIGRTYPPQPENAGTVATAGRIFAEHVFTRLFAPPGERHVHRTDIEHAPATLPRHTPRSFASMFEGGDMTPDAAVFVFGLVHTDSNQHVNSLVYLRLFEEAVLRRSEMRGKLTRKVEIVYRKPCFAGDRMRLHISTRDGNSATVAVAPDGAPPTKAHAVARMTFA
jgi:hypothetical protein